MRERKTDWGAAGSVRTSRRSRRRSPRYWMLAAAVIVLGVLVLPRFTIDGRHWHLYLLP